MIRNVAVLRWKAGTTSAQVQRATDGPLALVAAILQIRALTCGPDVDGQAGHWDYAVVSDHDDVADCQAYAVHPEHRRVIDEAIVPILEGSASMQFQVV